MKNKVASNVVCFTAEYKPADKSETMEVLIQVVGLTAFIQADGDAEIPIYREDDHPCFVMKKDLFNFCIKEF